MFRTLYPCPTINQANEVRRVIARNFGVPIATLLVQFDLAHGGKTPSVFYDAELSHRLSAEAAMPGGRRTLEDWEAALAHDALRDKIRPFLHGYFQGRRKAR